VSHFTTEDPMLQPILNNDIFQQILVYNTGVDVFRHRRVNKFFNQELTKLSITEKIAEEILSKLRVVRKVTYILTLETIGNYNIERLPFVHKGVSNRKDRMVDLFGKLIPIIETYPGLAITLSQGMMSIEEFSRKFIMKLHECNLLKCGLEDALRLCCEYPAIRLCYNGVCIINPLQREPSNGSSHIFGKECVYQKKVFTINNEDVPIQRNYKNVEANTFFDCLIIYIYCFSQVLRPIRFDYVPKIPK